VECKIRRVFSYTAAFAALSRGRSAVARTAVSCRVRPDYDAKKRRDKVFFDFFLDHMLPNRKPGNQPNVVTQMFDHEHLRTSTTEPIMLNVVTMFLTSGFHSRTLYIEDKDSTLSQVMQWFGTFRIRAVAHHLSFPLRLQRFFRSGAD
jgi:hypothetical protein